MTAPVGWLAARLGRKWLYVVSFVGFTLTSMLCGVAQLLWQIVLFRLLQGMFSASLVPLAQTTLFDLYPHERRGFAMAIWGVGLMIGPIMGPPQLFGRSRPARQRLCDLALDLRLDHPPTMGQETRPQLPGALPLRCPPRKTRG